MKKGFLKGNTLSDPDSLKIQYDNLLEDVIDIAQTYYLSHNQTSLFDKPFPEAFKQKVDLEFQRIKENKLILDPKECIQFIEYFYENNSLRGIHKPVTEKKHESAEQREDLILAYCLLMDVIPESLKNENQIRQHKYDLFMCMVVWIRENTLTLNNVDNLLLADLMIELHNNLYPDLLDWFHLIAKDEVEVVMDPGLETSIIPFLKLPASERIERIIMPLQYSNRKAIDEEDQRIEQLQQDLVLRDLIINKKNVPESRYEEMVGKTTEQRRAFELRAMEEVKKEIPQILKHGNVEIVAVSDLEVKEETFACSIFKCLLRELQTRYRLINNKEGVSRLELLPPKLREPAPQGGNPNLEKLDCISKLKSAQTNPEEILKILRQVLDVIYQLALLQDSQPNHDALASNMNQWKYIDEFFKEVKNNYFSGDSTLDLTFRDYVEIYYKSRMIFWGGQPKTKAKELPAQSQQEEPEDKSAKIKLTDEKPAQSKPDSVETLQKKINILENLQKDIRKQRDHAQVEAEHYKKQLLAVAGEAEARFEQQQLIYINQQKGLSTVLQTVQEERDQAREQLKLITAESSGGVDVKALQDELEQTRIELQSTTKELADVRKQLGELHAQLQAATDKQKKTSKTIGARNNTIKQLKSDNAELAKTIEKLKQKIESSQEIQSQKILETQKQLRQQAAELSAVNKSNHELLGQLEEAVNKKGELQAKLEQIEDEQTQQADKKLKDLVSRHEEQLDQLRAQLSDRTEALTRSKKECRNQSEASKRKTAQVKEKEKGMAQLQAKVDTLQTELENTKILHDQLAQAKTELASLTKEAQKAQEFLLAEQKASSGLRKTLDDKEQELEQARKVIRESKSKSASQGGRVIPQAIQTSKQVVFDKMAVDEQQMRRRVSLVVPQAAKRDYSDAIGLLQALEEGGVDRAFIEGGFPRSLLAQSNSYELSYNDIDIITTRSVDWVLEHSNLAGYSFEQVHPDIPYLFRDTKRKIDLVCNPNLDLVAESKKRDFRCNAIFINSNGEIVDTTKKGLQDIWKEKFVSIGDCAQSFKQDPSRMLRLIRLSVTLGWSIDEFIPVLSSLMPNIFQISFGVFNKNMRVLFEGDNKLQTLALLDKQGWFKVMFGFQSFNASKQTVTDFLEDVVKNNLMYQDQEHPYIYSTALFLSLRFNQVSEHMSAQEVAESFVMRFRGWEHQDESFQQSQIERLATYIEFYHEKFNEFQNLPVTARSEPSAFDTFAANLRHALPTDQMPSMQTLNIGESLPIDPSATVMQITAQPYTPSYSKNENAEDKGESRARKQNQQRRSSKPN